jgi:hypothetical protein
MIQYALAFGHLEGVFDDSVLSDDGHQGLQTALPLTGISEIEGVFGFDFRIASHHATLHAPSGRLGRLHPGRVPQSVAVSIPDCEDKHAGSRRAR